MKIFIASDHAGFELKKAIKSFLKTYEVEDLGPFTYDPEDDYPDYALKVCEKVVEAKSKGILICGTGQGMNITANKIPGIYSALCWDKLSAIKSREHNNTNVLCLGAILSPETAKTIVKSWLETPFLQVEKHIRRIKKLKEIEKKYEK